MRLVLASKSITRRGIMDSLKIKYDVVTSDAEEFSESNDPRKYVEELSLIKAKAVAEKIDREDVVIIAADSIIYKDGKKYEKPHSIDEVIANLKELSNSVNQGITGVTIVDKLNSKILTFSCVTDVKFKVIDDEDIKLYIEHEEYLLDKAGYSLEGTMSLFVDKIDGDYYNVLGLPLGMIYTKIKELGYELKDFN